MFRSERRLFHCLGKEKGEDFLTSYQGFKNKWPEVEPSSRYGLWNMVDKLKIYKTLQGRWPISNGGMKSVWSGENIAPVSVQMWTLTKECCWVGCHKISKILNFWILSCTLLCMYLKSNQKKFHEFSGFFQEWPPLLILQRDRPKNTKENFESHIFTI